MREQVERIALRECVVAAVDVASIVPIALFAT